MSGKLAARMTAVFIGALAVAGAWAADAAPVPEPAASAVAPAPAEAASAPAPVAPADKPVDPDAPLATPTEPTTPTPESVPGGPRVERVQVTDPYIELHTFPGRGYPVFYVAARGEWISIELRHTDWYKVRTATGKVGWVNRRQLETTLTESGQQQGFRDVRLDDYLARRWDLGAAYGRFHGEPMDKFWISYRISDTLSLESAFAQVQGRFSGTTLWHVNMMAEPWSDQRFSPFLGIGLGKFKNVPNPSLVQDLETNVRMADAVVGARFHLSDRFEVRADYTIYTAFTSDVHTLEYHAATLGIGIFF
jgi:hypothetical protein